MKKVLKWTGLTLGSVIVLLVLAVSGFYTNGRMRVGGSYEAPAAGPLAASASTVERGQHIMRIHGCQECHGQNLEGKVFADIPPGKLVAANLTAGRGGVAASYKSADDWARAFRQGVRPDGSWILPFMPYTLYHGLADDDAAALAAYLAQVPAVDNELPKSQLRFLGYMIFGMPGGGPKKLLAEAGTPPKAAPAVAPTAEYGAYISSHLCVECHGGAPLTGGKHPDPSAPPGPGLMHIASWSFDDFAKIMRTGQGPNGKQLSHYMPWAYFASMTDVEIQALQAHIQTLAAAPAP